MRLEDERKAFADNASRTFSYVGTVQRGYRVIRGKHHPQLWTGGFQLGIFERAAKGSAGGKVAKQRQGTQEADYSSGTTQGKTTSIGHPTGAVSDR